MAEYIDREALIAEFKRLKLGENSFIERVFADGVYAIIEQFHAADVTPVVHGRWEWLGPNRLVADCMCGTCSACKVRSKYIVNTMLCPNCGAKMMGGNT